MAYGWRSKRTRSSGAPAASPRQASGIYSRMTVSGVRGSWTKASEGGEQAGRLRPSGVLLMNSLIEGLSYLPMPWRPTPWHR
jgi:hypothetical protein